MSMENLWVRTIFVDMEEIYGHEILAMEKFCLVGDVGSWKILWLWFWICGNLFVHGHGHVE